MQRKMRMGLVVGNVRLEKVFWILLLFCVAITAHAKDQALFWSIEGEHGHAGYLLGTIHSEDPRVLEFTEPFLEALSNSAGFAMELVPDMPTLMQLAETMNLPEGTDLASILGADRFALVATAMQAYGIQPEQLHRMKPWAALMTLSVPPPVTGFFMDFSLSLRANGNGLKVIGLESLDEQLAFLENMPLEHLIRFLDQAVIEAGQVQELHNKMVETYLQGDLDALNTITDKQLSEVGPEAHDLFISQGIHARNHTMLKNLLVALQQGTVFTAVGALHLPGEEGLINLLREQGFRLVPQPHPFPVEKATR